MGSTQSSILSYFYIYFIHIYESTPIISIPLYAVIEYTQHNNKKVIYFIIRPQLASIFVVNNKIL